VISRLVILLEYESPAEFYADLIKAGCELLAQSLFLCGVVAVALSIPPL